MCEGRYDWGPRGKAFKRIFAVIPACRARLLQFGAMASAIASMTSAVGVRAGPDRPTLRRRRSMSDSLEDLVASPSMTALGRIV